MIPFLETFRIVLEKLDSQKISTGLKVDVNICKVSEFDKTRFLRRQKVMLWEGFEAYLASPEDVIIKKLEFFRDGGSEKHLRDIKGILANTEIDMNYIEGWIEKLNLKNEWKKAY